MTTMEQTATYQTRELPLAAYLSLKGYSSEMQRDGQSHRGHPLGKWVFTDRDGNIGDHVQQFNSGEAKVEPSRFLNEVNSVRTEMLDFLGVSRHRAT